MTLTFDLLTLKVHRFTSSTCKLLVLICSTISSFNFGDTRTDRRTEGQTDGQVENIKPSPVIIISIIIIIIIFISP